MTDITYLPESEIKRARTSETPTSGRTRSGYGNRIPTSYELQLSDRRWRRVYVVQWSNAGSAYINVNGKPHYLGSIDPRDFLPKV
jgi:hypothetical protein